MSAKLEHSCEELIIQLMKQDPRLSGMTFRHGDEAKSSETECIVVVATRGPKMEAGWKGYEVDVEATYRTATGAPSKNDAICDAMTESVFAATPGCVPALGLFSDLSIEPDGSSDRDNTRNLKRRSRSFSLMAKEKA